MRLLRLHVENFGIISQLDLDFQEGVNEVLKENGWGKSTLAAFLRTMFYGLEGERKKGLSENDRMKYKPWNQGSFGGSIEFEAEGKRYLVTRDFGRKDKEGTFRLQDAVTLLDSKDYSERLGEELFGIDRESFERTSFIDGGSLHYHGINSAIGSKVGSVSQSDDLSNYDAAMEQMKNYLNANSPKKKLGALYKLEDEIRFLEHELAAKAPLMARVETIKKQRETENEKLVKDKAERGALQEELNGLSEKQARAMNQKRLGEFKEAAAQRLSAVKAREESFGGRIPSREELSLLGEKTEAAKRARIQLESRSVQTENERLERLKRYFRLGVPAEREITEQIENCNALQDGIQKRNHLEEQAEKEKRQLEEYRLELQRLEAQAGLAAAQRRAWRGKMIAIGCGLLGAGAVLGILTILLHWSALLWIPAALLMVAGCILTLTPWIRSGAREDVPAGETELIRRQSEAEKGKIEELKQELQALEQDLKGKEDAVRSFLEAREIPYSRTDAESILYELKGRRAEYQALLSEEEERALSRKKLAEEGQRTLEDVREVLEKMELPFSPSDHEKIENWIRETMLSLSVYEKEKREERDAREALETFLSAHPEVTKEANEEFSEEEVESRRKVLTERIGELSNEESHSHEILSAYQRDLETAYDNLEELDEKEEKLLSLKEQRDADLGKYQLVEKTQEWLRTAKEQFIARFMQPIKTAFDGYYEIMTQGRGSGSEFQIDANMNISRKEEGVFHDVETQSDGYGDVIGLCIRMALLDVMYEKEKPLVIMDDPFTNLDEEHLKGAKEFLKIVSQRYQILYMTCHEDRKYENMI